MPIVDEVTHQLTAAMKARETQRVAALRQMRTAFLNEMKKDGARTLEDEACVAALRRLEKQRKESIEAFEAAGRTEQAAAEQAELAVIQEFLPKLADEARTREWARAAVETTGASSPRDAGKVMGALMREHKGEIDGNLARRLVQELLAGGSEASG